MRKRERDRQTDRQTETDRDRDRERDRGAPAGGGGGGGELQPATSINDIFIKLLKTTVLPCRKKKPSPIDPSQHFSVVIPE